jgi:hypothetical protein
MPAFALEEAALNAFFHPQENRPGRGERHNVLA